MSILFLPSLDDKLSEGRVLFTVTSKHREEQLVDKIPSLSLLPLPVLPLLARSRTTLSLLP